MKKNNITRAISLALILALIMALAAACNGGGSEGSGDETDRESGGGAKRSGGGLPDGTYSGAGGGVSEVLGGDFTVDGSRILVHRKGTFVAFDVLEEEVYGEYGTSTATPHVYLVDEYFDFDRFGFFLDGWKFFFGSVSPLTSTPVALGRGVRATQWSADWMDAFTTRNGPKWAQQCLMSPRNIENALSLGFWDHLMAYTERVRRSDLFSDYGAGSDSIALDLFNQVPGLFYNCEYVDIYSYTVSGDELILTLESSEIVGYDYTAQLGMALGYFWVTDETVIDEWSGGHPYYIQSFGDYSMIAGILLSYANINEGFNNRVNGDPAGSEYSVDYEQGSGGALIFGGVRYEQQR